MKLMNGISIIAVALAGLSAPQVGAQGIGIDVGGDVGGGGAGVDAGIDIGGESGVDAGIDIGSGGGGADGSSGAPRNLVEADIDLLDDGDELDAEVNVIAGGSQSSGPGSTSGVVRIGALDSEAQVTLLSRLLDDSGLSGDLDSQVDDTQVSISVLGDVADSEVLAEVRANIGDGAAGRDEAVALVEASAELGFILGREGIDAGSVIAVTIGEGGQTEVIVDTGLNTYLANVNDDNGSTSVEANVNALPGEVDAGAGVNVQLPLNAETDASVEIGLGGGNNGAGGNGANPANGNLSNDGVADCNRELSAARQTKLNCD